MPENKMINKIVDAKYEKSDLDKSVYNQRQYLTEYKHNNFLDLQLKFEDLFNVTLGT